MKQKLRRILAVLVLLSVAACILSGCYTTANFGYIDTQGNWAIKPAYQQAYPFHDGYAVCMWGVEGSAYAYGLIDEKGERVGNQLYDAMRGYYDGMVVASDLESKHWAYFDLEGNNIFGDKEFYDASVFSCGLAPAAELDGDHLYGYIDQNGEWAITPQFELASVFDEETGLAMIRRGGESTGKYGFIDLNGNMVIDYSFSYAGSFSEGFAPVKKSTISGALDWGFINPQGEIVYEAGDWGYCRGFSEGLAAVCVGDPDGEDPKWGYINTNGEWVIEPTFYAALSFTDGLAAVNFGGDGHPEWGYINPQGEIVVEAIYESAGQFSDGLAAVYDYDYRG